MKKSRTEEVIIDSLVAGGQGIGTLASGKKVFVWNSLPGERVIVSLTRNKRDYAEGIAIEIIEKSPDRDGDGSISAVDLATRPWSIIRDIETEHEAKRQLVTEIYRREGVRLPTFEVKTTQPVDNYRNKMEYCFWGDDKGVHLAHFKRGSHGKVVIEPEGDRLSTAQIGIAAAQLVACLNDNNIRASQMKSVIFRSAGKQVVIALFVKEETFPRLHGLPKNCVVYFSNPKSPASVPTKELYRTGSTLLTENIGKTRLSYDVLSFFQINVPVFCMALDDMREHILSGAEVVDMYAGVGTIGLSLGARPLTLVELDPINVQMARNNCDKEADVAVVQASTEQALDYIRHDACIVVDPPRSGLHKNVRSSLLDKLPRQVVYLSCNPVTQARDVTELLQEYELTYFCAYNFFPRTPHIETLAVLERR